MERVSKYPKSTKYGRQNPTSERWNSEEQLVKWRAAWADEVNLFLEQKGLDERIDHRSFADQGKDEQPTIHEGVAARAMEKKGFVSDRCELNRQIRRDNTLLQQLNAEMQKLVKAVQNSIPALAQAMEKLRASMIMFSYQVIHVKGFITKTRADMEDVVLGFKQYNTVTGQIKLKLTERIKLLTEKEALSPLQFSETRRLNAKIAEATEDLEELKSRKELIMFTFGKYDDNGMKDVKSWINRREEQIQKAEAAEDKYSSELNKALSEYRKLEVKAAEFNLDELKITRLSLRPEEEMRAVSTLKSRYGNSYDPTIMLRAKDKTANLLSKESAHSKDHSPNQNRMKTPEKEFQRMSSRKKKAKEWER